ncbi:redoxin family protein [Pseudomaricurvus alkylphenolicus]|uniref:redoxin family protein n=1 Tax=Pseudomaricurvus alkylphenolicus TaxID=1306991 RepID=UPI001424930C|nr:redoxin family protein [Pseudomaricurvus alkylphenolicus]NIB42778.1 redoxin family protein [Pseudomaricurvus alkylphenolicus]
MRPTKHAVTLLGLLLLWLSAATHSGAYNKVLNIGDTMPDFHQLPSTEDTRISSSDLTESVVVLVSLANHCPWVKGMDAELVALVDSFKDADVRILGFGVNHREDDRLPAMKEHARHNGYNFSYVFDESQQLGRQLGATRTPEYFVFNRHRKLVYMGLLTNSPAMKRGGKIRHINGEPSEFYVSDAIKNTLQGEPVDPQETRAHGCTVKYES